MATPPSFSRSADAAKTTALRKATIANANAQRANLTKQPTTGQVNPILKSGPRPGQPGGMIPPIKGGTMKKNLRKGSPGNMDLQRLAQSRLKRM